MAKKGSAQNPHVAREKHVVDVSIAERLEHLEFLFMALPVLALDQDRFDSVGSRLLEHRSTGFV